MHVNYAETVLPMKDGLPKLKDFPPNWAARARSCPSKARPSPTTQFRPRTKNNDAEKFRTTQVPLKERFKKNAKAALLTLKRQRHC